MSSIVVTKDGKSPLQQFYCLFVTKIDNRPYNINSKVNENKNVSHEYDFPTVVYVVLMHNVSRSIQNKQRNSVDTNNNNN